MRVLLITGSLPPMKCGIGDYTAHLARALSETENVQVAVLTDVKANPVPTNLNYKVFPIVRGWLISDLKHVVDAIRAWNPDLVHIQYPTQGYGRSLIPWILPTFLTLFGIPVAQTWHDCYFSLKGSLRNLPNAVLPGGLVVVRPNYKGVLPGWYRWLIQSKHFRFIRNSTTIQAVAMSEEERSSIREKYKKNSEFLVSYFGFVYPAKGIEYLFQVADPNRHHLMLICDLDPSDPYHKMILERSRDMAWRNKITITGFLPAEEVGQILAASDAVVLPFLQGGGIWNTSLHAALKQGTFILTTSLEKNGYMPSDNIHYSRPGDVLDMRQALNAYIGRRNAQPVEHDGDWHGIAAEHVDLYRAILR